MELETQGFISLDKGSRQQHARSSNNVAEWTQQLHATIKEQWRNRFGPRYSEVKVLLTFWEADDLGVIKEIAMLDQAFTDFYRYDVSVYRIPSQNSDRELKRHVIEFVTDNDRPKTLLIFYYGGHSSIDQQRHETYWTANRSRNSPTLPASGVQSLFEGTWCDALLLYDSCHSATEAITNTASSSGVTELVAACGFESKAAEVDEHSFSNALAQALVVSSQGPPFSVAELHSRTLLQLKNWTPAPMRDDQGRFLHDEDGRPLLDPQRRRTPVHVNLTHEGRRRHILLAPFPKRAHDGEILSNPLPRPVLTEALAVALGSKDSSTSSVSIRSTTSGERNAELVISVKLRNDLPAVDGEMMTQAWVDWLRSAPPEAEDLIEISVKEHSPSEYFDCPSYHSQRDVDSRGLAESSSDANGQRDGVDPGKLLAPFTEDNDLDFDFDLIAGIGDMDSTLSIPPLSAYDEPNLLSGAQYSLPRALPSASSLHLYPELLGDFSTRRMRLNKWLENIILESRLESDILYSTLRDSLGAEDEQMPSNWAQLVIAYWELDGAAKSPPRYEDLNEVDDGESSIIGVANDGGDESSVATRQLLGKDCIRGEKGYRRPLYIQRKGAGTPTTGGGRWRHFRSHPTDTTLMPPSPPKQHPYSRPSSDDKGG